MRRASTCGNDGDTSGGGGEAHGCGARSGSVQEERPGRIEDHLRVVADCREAPHRDERGQLDLDGIAKSVGGGLEDWRKGDRERGAKAGEDL